MDSLYEKILMLYQKELLRLNIGYNINEDNLDLMLEILFAIDYINYGCPDSGEYAKIIAYYE